MSSKSRNFRRRTDDTDEDNENTTTKPQSKPTTATNKTQSKPTSNKPKKHPNQTPKNLLSFVDDEEPDPSPITRPSSSSSRFTKPSHKLTSTKDRNTPPSSSSLPSNVTPQAGTYTKEALLELQKNTRTLSSSRPVSTTEPVIVLKGLLKPSIDTDPDSQNPPNALLLDNHEIGIDGTDSLLRRDKGGDDFVPDQATIAAIRAKRERLRQSRSAAQDYIALDGGSNHGEREGLSDEEPEFQGRIGFFVDKIDGGKKGGVFEDVDERVIRRENEVEIDDVDGDEDEEDKIWEEEQFRKGLGKRMDDGSSSVVNMVQNQSVQQPKFGYSTGVVTYPLVPGGAAVPSIGGVVGVLPNLDVLSIPQQSEIAMKALHENLRRLKESHGRTMTSLTRTEENISASLLNVTTLENSLSAAGEKFIFMQKLRDFVSVICDFLQHKAPFIEELEDHMQKLHEERAAAILERRAADSEDEMMELEAAVQAAMSVFNKGGGSAALIEAATSAAKAASAAARESRNLAVKLDEFGRDVNLQKRMDMTRRAESRQRRKAQSDSKRMSAMETENSYEQVEGESSTDESDSESTAYQSNRDQLLQIAEQVLSDAAEEYSQLSGVIQRFERWKQDYSPSYRDAYMSLSVLVIFSPYVRLELLKWDPLHEDADFIDMNWHSLLFNYGLSEDDMQINPDDADANLVPELVEKLAVPILHHQIECCWDMFSTRETKFAVSATNLVFRYVPLSSMALGNLIALLRDRLAHAVENHSVPCWNTLVMKAVPNAARVAAYRFGMSVRLMRNICLWNKILAMPVLEKLALDDLLSGKVLPHLRSIQSNTHDAVTRTERVIASLSGVWASSSVTGERSPKLQPLVDYVLRLGKTVEKKHASGGMEADTGGLARRLKKMLVELNEYDHARAISRTFNLREAL